ncbi:MAG: AsmA-like C-terminal domain-containing protein [Methylocapsa sp.]|nr:AsmA-like C-terminal domain-containing protein [Methylocapsa sp.]
MASGGERTLFALRMGLRHRIGRSKDAAGRFCAALGRIPGVAWRSFLLPKLALGLFSLLLLLVVFVAARLSLGPIPADGFAPRIARAMAVRFGHGYEFSIGSLAIAFDGAAPVLRIDRLSVKELSGRSILAAPRADVSVGPLALLAGRISLKRLEIYDAELHLVLRPNGSLALPVFPGSAGAEGVTLPPPGAVAPEGVAPSVPMPQANTPSTPNVAPLSSSGSRFAAIIRLALDELTGPDSFINAIRRVGIMRGKIVIDDETAAQKLVFNGVNIEFDRFFGSTRFDLSADGPSGRWRAFGAASGGPGLERSLALSASNLTLDEILLAAGTRTIGVDFDLPLSGDLDIRLGADGMISQAAGRIESGSGYFRFNDPDSEPVMVDKMSGWLHWNGAKRRIVIDRLQMAAGASHFAGYGSIGPPGGEGDPWSIHLANTEPNVLGPERPGEKPILIELMDVTARLFIGRKQLAIDRFSFSGPQCGLALGGMFDWSASPHLRLGASISPTPIKIITRLWPSFVAASVRSYLLSRASGGIVEKGTIQIDFDAADLKAIQEQHAPADSKALVEFTIKNGSLQFLPGVPPLRAIEGTGRVTGRTAAFTVSGALIEPADGRVLTLSDGSFGVADTDPKPVPAVAQAKVMGSVEAIGALLSFEALKPYASLPLDSATLKGQASGNVEIAMKLGADTGPQDTNLRVEALASNLSAERLIGNENLDGATLMVNVDPAGLRASGQGTMFGAPVTVSIEKLTGQPAEASIGMTLDETLRQKLGFGALPGLSGPIGAKISAPIGTGEKPKARVELDLAAAAIDIPGISKPEGEAGKISFEVTPEDGVTALDQIEAEAGPVRIRGKMELGPGFSLIAASFPQVKLSSGDGIRLDATGAGDTMKVVVRGSSMDARPLLKSLIFDPPKGNRAASEGVGKEAAVQAKEIEFDVKADALTGHNNQTIADAELLYAKRGTELKQFSFSGTFGADTVSANLTGGGTSPQLNLVCSDAGALLSFLDLYDHMQRGQLRASMVLEPDAITGVLVIENFVLRDEPALRRLVVEGTPQDERGGRPRIDTNAVAFNKLQVRFQRDGSRLALSDGTMNGDAIGLTVDGAIDYARDIVDMKGTFVPVYSFNNMFAKIPFVGPILGGHSDEGLIGLNYRISGQASAPTLSVNPLSAIAPGIFRQIFGIVDFNSNSSRPQR